MIRGRKENLAGNLFWSLPRGYHTSQLNNLLTVLLTSYKHHIWGLCDSQSRRPVVTSKRRFEDHLWEEITQQILILRSQAMLTLFRQRGRTTIQSLIPSSIHLRESETAGHLCHLGQLYTLMLKAANKMQMFLPASQTHQTHP